MSATTGQIVAGTVDTRVAVNRGSYTSGGIRIYAYATEHSETNMKNKSRVHLRAIVGLLGVLTLSQNHPALAQQSGLTEDSGLAAVYSDKLAGHITASGKKYEPSKLTAAHRTLPFGTHVKVTNTGNGKSVTLEINDRGPKQKERVLDISASAAHALGISKYKMAPVKLEVMPAP